MPSTVILGERHCQLSETILELRIALGEHIQDSRTPPCIFRDIPFLETTWQEVFGIECISCSESPQSFILLANAYSPSERADVLFILRNDISECLKHSPGSRRSAWERLLRDDTIE